MNWVIIRMNHLIIGLEEAYRRALAPHYLIHMVQYLTTLQERQYLAFLKPGTMSIVEVHQRRIWLLEIVSIGIILILVILAYEFATFLNMLDLSQWLKLALAYSIYIFLLSAHYIIVSKWITRFFAESIAIGSLIYCLHTLLDENVLDRLSGKKAVQHDLHVASVNTLRMVDLLPAPSKEAEDWARAWLGGVASYLVEREKWVLTPRASTVKHLRDDLARLLPIYISGHYDDFSLIGAATGTRGQASQVDKPPNEQIEGPPTLKIVAYLLAVLVMVVALRVLGVGDQTYVVLVITVLLQAIGDVAEVPGVVALGKLLPS